MEVLGLIAAALVASAAWLYQRAWERQERRIARYQEFVDRLPAFTSEKADNKRVDEAIAEVRRLWLSAPDDVIRSAERLIDFAQGERIYSQQKVVGDCMIAMRKDATMMSALFPRFWRSRLSASDFRLRGIPE